jgi:hypothetical protein
MKEGDSADTTDMRRQLPLPDGYTNVRNAGSETEWLQPAYIGEQLSVQSHIVDIVTRQGRAGLGIYITQEEQILNSRQQIVMLAAIPSQCSQKKNFPISSNRANNGAHHRSSWIGRGLCHSAFCRRGT